MKTAFITGCANGIGLRLAQRLLASGYRVIATDIDLAKLQSHSWPKQHCWLKRLDVSKAEQWKAVFQETLSEVGRIDILINNAGVIKPNFLTDSTLQEVDFHIDINLKGVMYGTKVATDHFVTQGSGQVINIASLAGVAPIGGLSAYSAAKFGVRGFSLAVAQELRTKNIAMSVVCPDLVDTDMLTLQLDYPAANMTFSGNAPLSVDTIVNAIIRQGIEQKQLEVMVPSSRGWLAKFGNSFPGLSSALSEMLSKKGDKRRQELIRERK